MVEATCLEYGSSPPIHLDLCADDEDPSQLIIRPGWDAPTVRCFPRTFYAWPCLLRQVGTVLGSPYDCVVASLAYANPGSRQSKPCRTKWGGEHHIATDHGPTVQGRILMAHPGSVHGGG